MGVGAGLAFGVAASVDEGLQRSLYFWRHAFPIYARYRFTLWRVGGDPENVQDAAFEELHERYARRVLDIILHLGGFYVKIGQVGATRADMVPPQYMDALSVLQDDVPPLPFPLIREIVEAELGAPIEAVFSSFEEESLGAASIGQVHRAVVAETGTQVVVKVQYPHVEGLFRTDVATIRAFCKLAQPAYVSMIDEIERQFLTEFDYIGEARHLEEIADNLEASPYAPVVVVPRPIPHLCTRSVLVMDYLEGEKLHVGLTRYFEAVAEARGVTFEQLKVLQSRKTEAEPVHASTMGYILSQTWIYASTYAGNAARAVYNYSAGLALGHALEYAKPLKLVDVDAIMANLVLIHGYEVLVNGAFNGDPHPGNILLLPDSRIGLIDYGQVKHITDHERLLLAQLIIALADEDDAGVVQLMREMGFRSQYDDEWVIRKLATVFFDRDTADVTGGLNIQLFFEELDARDPIVVMPEQYIMAGRLCMLMRGLGYMLNMPISIAKSWRPLAVQVLRDNGIIINPHHDPATPGETLPTLPGSAGSTGPES